MKNNTLPAIVLMAALMAASCAKELTIDNSALSYNIRVEADFSATKAVADGGTATFTSGDKVCVYNQTKAAVDANVLTAATTGPSTTFSGTLAGTYEVGDVLQLFYNTPTEVVDYTVQDGTIDHVTDVAVATVSVTGVIGSTVSTGKATFTNHQSIYKFTFKNGATTLNVRAVTIRSAGNKLVTKDNLLSGASYGAVSISNETAQSAVYAALKFSSNPSETISFTLVDDNGILYTGSKSSPAGGLVDNQFYTSEVSVTPSATMPYPFTIDNYTSKSVYLAAGNLYFKDNQYTFYPCKAPFHEPAGDLTAEQRRDRCWFQWGVVNTSFASASSTQNVYFNGTASQGWYTLTQEQWHCLYGQRQMSSSNIWP